MKLRDWAILGLGGYLLVKWLGRGFQVGDPLTWDGGGRFGRMIFGPGGAKDVKGKTLIADGPAVFDYASTSPPWSAFPVRNFTGTQLQDGDVVGTITETYILPEPDKWYKGSNWVKVKTPPGPSYWVFFSNLNQAPQTYKIA